MQNFTEQSLCKDDEADVCGCGNQGYKSKTNCFISVILLKCSTCPDWPKIQFQISCHFNP